MGCGQRVGGNGHEGFWRCACQKIFLNDCRKAKSSHLLGEAPAGAWGLLPRRDGHLGERRELVLTATRFSLWFHSCSSVQDNLIHMQRRFHLYPQRSWKGIHFFSYIFLVELEFLKTFFQMENFKHPCHPASTSMNMTNLILSKSTFSESQPLCLSQVHTFALLYLHWWLDCEFLEGSIYIVHWQITLN